MEQPPVQRTCPLCGQSEEKALFTKAKLRLVVCKHCSMIYANPVSQELASGAFYDRLGTPFYLSPDKLESDYAPVRFERELRLFRAFCRRGKVLDVGCSTGAFLFNLQARHPGDYSVVGTDVTSAALDHAESRGIPVLRNAFLELDQPEERFDAITFWAVMEHLVHPKRFLAKAATLLKPGGSCFILVPNMRSLAVRLLGPKYRYIMPDHVNYFTSSTLRSFVECDDRLEVLQTTTTHFNPLVILQDFRSGMDRVPDHQRAHLLKRTTALKQNPLLRPVKAIYSVAERILASLHLADNLVVVARRKAVQKFHHWQESR